MVEPPVMKEAIVEGRRLVERARAKGLPIAVAGWFRVGENGPPELYVATPDEWIYGPRPIIRLLRETLQETGATSFDLADVRVVDASTHFVNGAMNAGGDPTRERVIGPQLVGGRFVERAFVYACDPSATPSPMPPGSRRPHEADAA
ncbi:hypothetical protein [Salinarimonas sp.]|uniref:hypothetical protein n=1 Tax=Salinarimonas sp. TaxID=2766526 RepID=UPI0032D94CF8